MKKLLSLFIAFIICAFFNYAHAMEIEVQGKGYAPLTGYNIKAVRDMQNAKMDKKAKNSNFEVLQTQQIKEASRQAETRKKQDARLSAAVREQVVRQAEDEALRAAINNLLDTVLGAGASKNPEVQSKFEEIVSQAETYTNDKEVTGDVEDNNYVATVILTVDETKFRNHVKNMGAAITLQEIRKHSIMVVMDEFFARPSDLNNRFVSEEVTTYKYDYDEKLKDHEKASASNYAKSNSSGSSSNNYNVNSKSRGSYNASASGGYSGAYGGGGYSGSSRGSHNDSYRASGSNSNKYNNSSSSGSSASYGHLVDYSKKENEFFQNIKKYDVASPKAENLNFTKKALSGTFGEAGLDIINDAPFRSKYFKGQPITSDKLENSAEFAKYIEEARKEGADFLAIGVSYVTDNGVNPNSGKNNCDANVYIQVYSTVDSREIASWGLVESGSGNRADAARTDAAGKAGKTLGEKIAKQVQDYWKDRMMYGFEYTVKINGSFMPVEKLTINKALQNVNGMKSVTPRESGSTYLEYKINYAGKDVETDVFTKLYESSLSAKFQNYDYTRKGGQIIFFPANQKGAPNL